MSYKPLPQDDRGGKDRVTTTDDEIQQLLTDILWELKKQTLALALITDTTISKEDVD